MEVEKAGDWKEVCSVQAKDDPVGVLQRQQEAYPDLKYRMIDTLTNEKVG